MSNTLYPYQDKPGGVVSAARKDQVRHSGWRGVPCPSWTHLWGMMSRAPHHHPRPTPLRGSQDKLGRLLTLLPRHLLTLGPWLDRKAEPGSPSSALQTCSHTLGPQGDCNSASCCNSCLQREVTCTFRLGMTADLCGLRTSGERLRWGREREGAEVSTAELNHATEFNVMRKEVTRVS